MANPNFAILKTLTAILRKQVYLKNNIVMDVVWELIIFWYMHMILGKFFKANPNFAILETLTAILRDQEYFENNMVMINSLT